MGAPYVLGTVLEPDRVGNEIVLQEPWLGAKRLSQSSRKNRVGLWRRWKRVPFGPQDARERTLGNSPNIMGDKMGGDGGSVVAGHTCKISTRQDGD